MSDPISEKKQIGPALLKPTRWDWFALILPLIALAPMLWFQSKLLWNRPHLQFFPMALICLVGFLYTSRLYGERSIGGFRRTMAYLLVLFGYGVALSATFLFSPWLSHLALFGFVAGWALVDSKANLGQGLLHSICSFSLCFHFPSILIPP